MGDTVPIEDEGESDLKTRKDKDGKGKSEKDKTAEGDKGKEGGDPENQAEDQYENSLVDDKRLFVMNLSYQVTHDELNELFGSHGKILDVEIPFGKRGRGPLGIGFIKFETAESAISAFAALDKSYFQGRKIHIKPAEKKQLVVQEEFK